jgi:hypothetical protein
MQKANVSHGKTKDGQHYEKEEGLPCVCRLLDRAVRFQYRSKEKKGGKKRYSM